MIPLTALRPGMGNAEPRWQFFLKLQHILPDKLWCQRKQCVSSHYAASSATLTNPK